MSEINLTELQIQIESLVQSRKKLASENKTLRNKLAKTIQERASLMDKKEMICKRLRGTIVTLKEQLQKL